MKIIFIILLSTAESNRGIDLNLTYLRSYPADIKRIISRPFHWDRADWIKTSGIISIGAILYFNDRKIQDWSQANRNSTSDNMSKYATYFGEKKVVAPFFFLYYLYGKVFHNKKAKHTALIGIESFIIAGIFTNLIKYSVHRSRPYTGDTPDRWRGPSFSLSDEYLSFPSGHSTTAFALATVFSNEYNTRFCSFLFYSLATLTAISRVNNNDHWASDVFFGGVIGYSTSKALLSQKQSRVSFSPYINGKSVGILMTIK